MNTDFAVSKTPVEIIKEGEFGGTSFRDISLVLMVNGVKICGKNLIS